MPERPTDIVVVGAAIADPAAAPGSGGEALAARAALAAVADAGLEKGDIDGLFTAIDAPELMYPSVLAQYLGLRPGYVDGTEAGGGSFEGFVHHAIAALRAGWCTTALVVYGRAMRSETAGAFGTSTRDVYGARGGAIYEDPYGWTIPAIYALAAQRYMHAYGATPVDLAQVAVDTRYNAAGNPLARYREPITVEDVLASPLVADPLRRLDCCVVSDGGGAIVLTTAAGARRSRRAPLTVLGTGEANYGMHPTYFDDLLDTPMRASARQALDQAGLRADEIDVFQVYDAFTICVLLHLEALGLCAPGEAGALVRERGLRYDAGLPTNTDGGGLSAVHPGARGIFLLVEAALQLWGEADSPVPGCRLAVCQGMGGYLSTASTVVLGL